MAVAKRLRAFEVKKVIYTNRKVNPEASSLNYELVEFAQLLKESDLLICAASLNETSVSTFDIAAFKQMKKTCSFFNVGRGGLVNHEDLYEALFTGIIESAGRIFN